MVKHSPDTFGHKLNEAEQRTLRSTNAEEKLGWLETAGRTTDPKPSIQIQPGRTDRHIGRGCFCGFGTSLSKRDESETGHDPPSFLSLSVACCTEPIICSHALEMNAALRHLCWIWTLGLN